MTTEDFNFLLTAAQMNTEDSRFFLKVAGLVAGLVAGQGDLGH